VNSREARCPECRRIVHVRSSGLFVAHRTSDGPHCAYSLGVSELPDLRSAPTLPAESRIDIIRRLARRNAKELS